MKINITPLLILLAGWCFFDRVGLGVTALSLVAMATLFGDDT